MKRTPSPSLNITSAQPWLTECGVWPLITRRFRNKFAISGYCQFFHFLSFGHLEVSYQISLRQRRPQMSKSPNQVELTLQISYKVIYSFYFDQKYGILKFLLNTTFCIFAKAFEQGKPTNLHFVSVCCLLPGLQYTYLCKSIASWPDVDIWLVITLTLVTPTTTPNFCCSSRYIL